MCIRDRDNVLANALKFTPSGGLVRVWLEEGSGSRRGAAARLARRFGLPLATFNLIVEDSGPGLSAAVQRRVFEPYNSGAGRGTGLGLSITRHLAESHGGRVRLASLPGRGTTFWLKLPRDPVSGSLLGALDQLQTALHEGSAADVPPLIGVIDLRHAECDGEAGASCLQEFQPNGRDDTTPCTELVPGLWAAAVTDPVNCNRRWVLHAARLGVGLEATRWEFMDVAQTSPAGATGHDGERRETMVNHGSAVPIII